MKTRKKRIIVIAVLTAIVLMAICSSGFMLRTAVFFHSPKSAITMKYEEIKSLRTKGTLYTITENAPVEKGTEAELTTWIVCRFGSFYYAKYYGEA